MSKRQRQNQSSQSLDEKFMIWINKVEMIVYRKLKLKLTDLPDENFYMRFNNGESHFNMADDIICSFLNEFNMIDDECISKIFIE